MTLSYSLPDGLQRSINALQTFCGQWKLNINHKKTCLTFTKGNQKEKHNFLLDGKILENVKEYKYLGIILQKRNCSFWTAIRDLSNKANWAIVTLNAKVKLIKIPVKIAIKIFDSMISHILVYRSEIWESYINYNTTKWEKSDTENVQT